MVPERLQRSEIMLHLDFCFFFFFCYCPDDSNLFTKMLFSVSHPAQFFCLTAFAHPPHFLVMILEFKSPFHFTAFTFVRESESLYAALHQNDLYFVKHHWCFPKWIISFTKTEDEMPFKFSVMNDFTPHVAGFTVSVWVSTVAVFPTNIYKHVPHA